MAVTLVVLLSIGATLVAPPPADELPSGSSFSRDPGGSAAAYLTLQALGYSIRRSFDPLASLSAPPGSVLLLVDPIEPASNQDRRAVQAFISAGGTALVTGCAGLSFLSGTTAGTGDPFPPSRIYRAELPSPLSAGAPAISMAVGCERSDLGGRYVPLYGDTGKDVVWFARIGKGRAIWWAASTPIANSAIDNPGHLELLLNTVGPRGRAILWDEFYHGQRRSLWSYASRTPLPLALAQVAVIALVAGAMYVRRRAPVRERFVLARTSPLEFVETMAGLYSRAPSAAAAVALARARLRRLLLDLTGLSGVATDGQLADAAAARLPFAADDLRTALEAADRAGADPVTTADAALPLVRRMQTFARMLHGGG